MPAGNGAAAGVGAAAGGVANGGQAASAAASKDRLFECFVCGRHFSRSDNLQRHVRIHTGDRPFECEACHLRFRRKDCLKTHMKSHHNVTGEAQDVKPPQLQTQPVLVPSEQMDIDVK